MLVTQYVHEELHVFVERAVVRAIHVQPMTFSLGMVQASVHRRGREQGEGAQCHVYRNKCQGRVSQVSAQTSCLMAMIERQLERTVLLEPSRASGHPVAATSFPLTPPYQELVTVQYVLVPRALDTT